MRRILSVLLENESGALSRVVGLFSQRGYNIESLTVAPTDDPTLSRMTIQTVGNEKVLEQIEKQLNKLIDVLKVIELSSAAFIEKEILLLKVAAPESIRTELYRINTIYSGQIVDMGVSHYTFQLIGDSEKLDHFIRVIQQLSNIEEIVRSGVVSIARS